MTLNYVDVSISREIPTVSRVGFGTLLFIGEKADADRVKEYADIDEVAEDFDEADEEYKAALAYFGQDETPSKIVIGNKGDEETYVEALSAIRDENDDWYALAIQSRDKDDIEAVAAAIQALDKAFLPVSADEAVYDSEDDTDVASVLLSNTYWRTGGMFHNDGASLYPECAWAGLMLPKDPGSATWAWKSLSGVTADTLTTTQRSAIEAKRFSYYAPIGGNNVTFEGATSEAGMFLDIVRGLDWLKFRMSEDIVARLASLDKLPYIGGAEILEQIIRSRLDIAVSRQVISPDYTVTVPPASEQEATDRANRIYRGITFRATLTGATHKVEVRGNVTV